MGATPNRWNPLELAGIAPYTLLDPMGTGNTHLINNCGEVVDSWTSDFASGGHATSWRMAAWSGSAWGPGGGVGGKLERRSWDGDLLWTLNWADDESITTTILHGCPTDTCWCWPGIENRQRRCLGWPNESPDDVAGVHHRNCTCPEGGTVVWEWHARTTSSKTGRSLGQPAIRRPPASNRREPRERRGWRRPGGASGDWIHANAVVTPQLDQIAISSRRFNEVWIIDHGITSEGGRARWRLAVSHGNPKPTAGDAEDQKLYGQHDVQWIPEGHPQAHQLMVYNNGDNRPGCDCSTIDV